jgi:hypothetical protein
MMRLTLLLSATLLWAPSPAAAQAAPVPVTVVLMDAFGDDRLVGAVRRLPGPDAKNLVVIKRSALTPELLVGLSKALAGSVQRQPGVPSAPINMYYMQDYRWAPASRAQLAWAGVLVDRLQTAGKISLGRLGNQRAIAAVFDSR